MRSYRYFYSIPEIGEDLPDGNPLLQKDGLPEFNNLTIEHCMAAIGKQTVEFENGIQRVEETLVKEKPKDIFKTVFEPLEQLGVALDITWGMSKTLYLGNSSLMPTKNYIAIHDRAKRARFSKYNSQPIYTAVKQELNSENKRNHEENRLLKKFSLEGKLNGLDLSKVQKAQLQESLNKLLNERKVFKDKVDVSTKQFVHYVNDPVTVQNFPTELLKSISTKGDNYINGPWKVTLQPTVCKSIMEYCPDRNIRWNVWQAIVSRGSGYANKELETSTHLEKIRSLRMDVAKILGYKTYVDMSMETKMAGSLQNVYNMIAALLESAKAAQERELQNLHKFATKSGFEGERLELWDVPYWRRKQCISLYNYNKEIYRQYFPLSTVLNGLFSLCEKIFDVTIKQRNNISTWHKDVQYFDVFEKTSSAPVAGFYLDPYSRSDEKIHIALSKGWMVGIRNRSEITDSKPLAALIFNFQPPTSETSSLLAFQEVKLLFQKFGQTLQHLLTKTRYSEVAGVSNIEWDAVEVCGHVLSHWLHNKSVIDAISSHVNTKEKLPQELFETLLNVDKHMAGLDLSRELYLSALDLELHSTKDFWLDIVKNLWPQYQCFPLDKLDSHPCSFTQIFSEEWAAAYYSQVWSRLIAADVYSAFHEVQGNENEVVNVGKRFRDTFLALGGSCHPSEVFRNFRGRDPSPKALLKSLGLKKTNIVSEN